METNFGGHEISKSIYSCWQSFAGIDFQGFLAGKHRIKFTLKGLINHYFNLKINSFRNKISYIRHTSKILSIGTPGLVDYFGHCRYM